MLHSLYKSVTIAVISIAMLGFLGTFKNATAQSTPHVSQTVDFNGDGRTDVTLFDRTTAQWVTYDFYTGLVNQFTFGATGARQVVGDYDGDRMTDPAVCFDNFKLNMKTWHIAYSQFGSENDVEWGRPGDIPVPADYDGDGITDIAFFRPFGGTWNILLSESMSQRVEQLGLVSDKLVPADYDGDGLVDIAVMRPEDNEWLIHFSADDTIRAIAWDVKSMPDDVYVPADYDGDGLADMAVYRSDGGIWIILESASHNYRFAQFGNGVYSGDPSQTEVFEANHDFPMPGDFDGDGIVDIAVWNAKTRIVNVLPSSSSIMSSIPIGSANSMPVSISIIGQ